MSEKQETHTPGPWHEYQSEKVTHKFIASKCGESIAKHVPNANARLIAAAPELLEQCKQFEKLLSTLIMEGHSGADLERDNLRAILDRVEGETAA
tara:strand:- start:177 stop:461 length:285 start_codon:yes stop_codon:yes gene_type:complete